ncbi:Protein sprT [hydrothermal vent metagenome]|uniref:Protein sprT n=1 Tax=hydrothermal vent metagenome TaxID=652676 RepID=A0A3B0YA79_9ZZZZ
MMPAMSAESINTRQKIRVQQATQACVARAASLFEREFAAPPVLFDLSGRAAGQYRVLRGEIAIRYNPYIFARYFDDNLNETVPHEVAHFVVDQLWGLRRVRAHGAEWRSVMRELGAEPRATARFDLTGLPVRRQRRFAYRCACRSHELTTCRHNRVQRGDARYHCRQCGESLVIDCP